MIIKKTYENQLLNFVIIHGGEIKFDKIIFPRSWQIASVRAVYFNEKPTFIETKNSITVKNWNKHVDKVRKAIGVKTYCVWVRDHKGDMVGIMAFYNKDGEEIKMKHFRKYKNLFEKIKNDY